MDVTSTVKLKTNLIAETKLDPFLLAERNAETVKEPQMKNVMTGTILTEMAARLLNMTVQ